MLITGFTGKLALDPCHRHLRYRRYKAQVTDYPIVNFDRIGSTGMKPTFHSLAISATTLSLGISAPIDPLVTILVTPMFGKIDKILKSLNGVNIGKRPLNRATVIILTTRFTDKTGPSVTSEKIGISDTFQLIDRKITNAKMRMSATFGIYGPTGRIGGIEKSGNGGKTGITVKNGRGELFAIYATIRFTVKTVFTVKIPMIRAGSGFDFYSECAVGAGCDG